MSKGIVVDHKETDVRYAISEKNFNPKVHTRVRDLKPGESIIGFTPKPRLQFEQDEAAREEELAAFRADLGSAQPEDAPEGYVPTQEEIDETVAGYTLDELKEFAKEAGLPVSGTKPELAAALLVVWDAAEEPTPDN